MKRIFESISFYTLGIISFAIFVITLAVLCATFLGCVNEIKLNPQDQMLVDMFHNLKVDDQIPPELLTSNVMKGASVPIVHTRFYSSGVNQDVYEITFERYQQFPHSDPIIKLLIADKSFKILSIWNRIPD